MSFSFFWNKEELSFIFLQHQTVKLPSWALLVDSTRVAYATTVIWKGVHYTLWIHFGVIKHLRLTLNLLSFVEYLCEFYFLHHLLLFLSNFWRRCRGEQRFWFDWRTKRTFFSVAGYRWRNRKICIAEIYKWLWASALESRDQKPSVLPRNLGPSRGSVAILSELLTIFLQGLWLCKIQLLQFLISCMLHHTPANNQQ